MDISAPQDREWAEEPTRTTWSKQVSAAKSVNEMQPLVAQLDEGMSLPTACISRQSDGVTKVMRLRLQFFKFWPSNELHTAWKDYMVACLPSDNKNALFILLNVLERICEQFVIRQQEKEEKKNKAAINAALQQNQQMPKSTSTTRGIPKNAQPAVASSRYQRATQPRITDHGFTKYFESSEEEDEEEDAE